MARLGKGRDVIIVIGADDKSGNVLQKAKIGLKDVAASGKKTKRSLRDMRGAWMAATAAAAAMVAVLGKIMQAYAEQERVERRLQSVLRARGIEVRKTSAHLFEFASALQQASIYGDEAIIPIQQLLMQLGELSGEALDRATRATLDFSSAMGIDLRSAAVLVSKAAVGNTSSLSRYGIMLDESIPKTEKFAAVLDLLEEKFGGTAQSEVETFSGQVAQLKNNVGDLAEGVGEMNSGVLTTAVRKWNDWALAASNAIARVNREAQGAEDVLVENMIEKLEREMEGVSYSIGGSLGELGGEGTEIINRPSLQRSLEIMTQITKLKDRLTFLKDSPESPLAGEKTGGAPAGTNTGGTDTGWKPTPAPGEEDIDAQALPSALVIEAERSLKESYRQEELEKKIAHAAVLADIDIDSQSISLEQWEQFEKTKTRVSREQQAMRIELGRQGLEALATLFPQVKAFAIGEAIINTYQGITKALASVPYPYNIAAAAVVAAQGFAAVKSIQKQGVTTGGGTSSYSYGGGTGGGGGPAATQPAAATNITIEARGMGDSGLIGMTPQSLAEQVTQVIEATGGQVGNVKYVIERT